MSNRWMKSKPEFAYRVNQNFVVEFNDLHATTYAGLQAWLHLDEELGSPSPLPVCNARPGQANQSNSVQESYVRNRSARADHLCPSRSVRPLSPRRNRRLQQFAIRNHPGTSCSCFSFAPAQISLPLVRRLLQHRRQNLCIRQRLDLAIDPACSSYAPTRPDLQRPSADDACTRSFSPNLAVADLDEEDRSARSISSQSGKKPNRYAARSVAVRRRSPSVDTRQPPAVSRSLPPAASATAPPSDGFSFGEEDGAPDGVLQ
ncbi:hypothetical protein ACLOJK_005788 [Asimina triloba]